MGGLAKHMSHIYDVKEFTFNDIYDIAKKCLSGDIEMVEKTDGQNCFVSFDEDGTLKFYRNMADLSGSGMTVNEIHSKWAEKPSVVKSFESAYILLDEFFSHLDEVQNLFNAEDVKCFINLEIICPDNFNVIEYNIDKTIIVMHGLKYLDDDNHETENSGCITFDDLMLYIDEVDNKYVTYDKSVKIKPIDNIDNILMDISNRLESILNEAGLDNMDATIGDYLEECFRGYIYDDEILSKLSRDVVEALVKRFVYSDKSVTLPMIKKHVTTEQYVRIVDMDKNQSKKLYDKFIIPIERLTLEFSQIVIKNSYGSINDNNYDFINKVKNRIYDLNANDEYKDDVRFRSFYDKWTSMGNEVNPIEGLVINYKGHMIKLVGSFRYVNQLMGYGRYNRTPETASRKTVFYPGSFSPFTGGHYSLIKSVADAGYNVICVMSSKSRDNIDKKISFDFANSHFSSSKVKFVIAPDEYTTNTNDTIKIYTPIQFVYALIMDRGFGNYSLLASSKGDDGKRVSDFLKYFENPDHNNNGHIKVFSLSDEIMKPALYKDRDDIANGQPISGTQVRIDLRNDDFDNFKKAYYNTGVAEDDLNKYFEELRKDF